MKIMKFIILVALSSCSHTPTLNTNNVQKSNIDDDEKKLQKIEQSLNESEMILKNIEKSFNETEKKLREIK